MSNINWWVHVFMLLCHAMCQLWYIKTLLSAIEACKETELFTWQAHRLFHWEALQQGKQWCNAQKGGIGHPLLLCLAGAEKTDREGIIEPNSSVTRIDSLRDSISGICQFWRCVSFCIIKEKSNLLLNLLLNSWIWDTGWEFFSHTTLKSLLRWSPLKMLKVKQKFKINFDKLYFVSLSI